MFLIDFFFYNFYRIIYGMSSERGRSTAGFATILVLAVAAATLYALAAKHYGWSKAYAGWKFTGIVIGTFLLFFFLYGNDKELKALEERRKNDSILWPFLFVLGLLGVYGYFLRYS